MIRSAEKIGVLYRTATPKPLVHLEQFRTRINSCLKRDGEVPDSRVADALYLSPAEYRKKYSPRRTFVQIECERTDIGAYFEEIEQPSITYSAFWQRIRRLKKEELLDKQSLRDAALLDASQWISFYGGGRRRSLRYDGVEHPELHGQEFRSISSFLRTIDRYKDKAIIWSRLKRGWEVDEALTEPVLALDSRTGTVYLIRSTACEEQYIGLTRTRIEQRWRTHLRAALEIRTNTPLAKAIRELDAETFSILPLEEEIDQAQLAQRERHWISELNTMEPNGFNVKPGGEMGGGQGKETTYEGEVFSSMEAASMLLSERTGIPKHVVLKRLRDGKIIPESARIHSDHPEAGSNLWRRWKSLINGAKSGRRGGEICQRWFDYDHFAEDVRHGYSRKFILVRIDVTKPWCGGNVEWVTKQRAIEKIHGFNLLAEGKPFPSLNAVAREYGIGRTTLKNRMEVQGLTLDEAVRMKLAPTSKSHRKQPVVVDGREFKSINSAAKFAADRFDITFDQAKDRIRRGVPLQTGGGDDA